MISYRIFCTFIRGVSGDSPLVGSSGVEPPTSRLSGARSNLLSYEPLFLTQRSPGSPGSGGDDGIRTHDPLLAGQVLSQLSYTPTYLLPLVSLSQLPKN